MELGYLADAEVTAFEGGQDFDRLRQGQVIRR
jgi:hypothetical protein